MKIKKLIKKSKSKNWLKILYNEKYSKLYLCIDIDKDGFKTTLIEINEEDANELETLLHITRHTICKKETA